MTTVGNLKKLIQDLPDSTFVVYDEGDGFAREATVFKCTGQFSMDFGARIKLIIDQDGVHVPDKSKLEFYVLNVR